MFAWMMEGPQKGFVHSDGVVTFYSFGICPVTVVYIFMEVKQKVTWVRA